MVSCGIRSLGTFTVTEMPVRANAFKISRLASKSLTRRIKVESRRKLATWTGGGRSSATVP
uniref:Putative ovule protein n=1 Tax=Solanum chacoense TaxID=4108 RepID=A0A0V0GLX1_SOLCH